MSSYVLEYLWHLFALTSQIFFAINFWFCQLLDEIWQRVMLSTNNTEVPFEECRAIQDIQAVLIWGKTRRLR